MRAAGNNFCRVERGVTPRYNTSNGVVDVHICLSDMKQFYDCEEEKRASRTETIWNIEIASRACRPSNCRSFVVLCSSLLFNFPPFATTDRGRRRRIDTAAAAAIDAAAATLKKGTVTVVRADGVRVMESPAPDKRNWLFGEWLSLLNAAAASAAVITFAVFQRRRRVSSFVRVRWTDKSIERRRFSTRAGCAFSNRFLEARRAWKLVNRHALQMTSTNHAVCLSLPTHWWWECIVCDISLTIYSERSFECRGHLNIDVDGWNAGSAAEYKCVGTSPVARQ